MFEYINGTLVQKDPTMAIIDVAGLGYQVLIPLSTYEKLPGLNRPVKLLTYFYVREDVQTLFGFSSPKERELFLMLVGISGIGPKMAITILSGASPEQFRHRIISGDVQALTLIPGIGPKTARRIIVELREKFVDLDEEALEGVEEVRSVKYSEEALKALTTLGYRRAESITALKKASRELEEDAGVEKILKVALTKM